MIAMLSRSSAAHRARSRANAAAKDSARAKMADAVAASRAFLRRLYRVLRDMPSASHGCFAGRLGPIPCARRSGLSRGVPVCHFLFRTKHFLKPPVLDLHPIGGRRSSTSQERRAGD
jgi:hypothetical protein